MICTYDDNKLIIELTQKEIDNSNTETVISNIKNIIIAKSLSGVNSISCNINFSEINNVINSKENENFIKPIGDCFYVEDMNNPHIKLHDILDDYDKSVKDMHN